VNQRDKPISGLYRLITLAEFLEIICLLCFQRYEETTKKAGLKRPTRLLKHMLW